MLIAKDKLITSHLNKYYFSNENKIFCSEQNFLIRKRANFFCCCNPHKHLLKYHLFQIESSINFHCKTYENLIILDNFDVEIPDLNMESFHTINNLSP